MPEGHLVHRAAREQTAALAGRVIAVSSPQGRLDVSELEGRRFIAAEAYGKHLFQGFDDGISVHVHLGMRGLFLRYEDPTIPPKGGTRLRLAGSVAFDLIAPMTCEVLESDGVSRIVSKLGPDPLRDDADEDDAVRRLRAAASPVAAAMTDQAVWSGVGNAWRAELLYLERLSPTLNAGALTEDQARALWRRTGELMAIGRDAGQVVSDPSTPDERWVYKRETCRGCGAAVRTEQVGGRTSYACTREQPA